MNNSRVVSNSIFYTTYKVLNVLFPLITTAYIARVLLPSGVGQVSYAQNIVTYFTSLAMLGLPIYGTREIAKARDNQLDQNKVFSELVIINFISTTLCCIAYLLLIHSIEKFKNNMSLYLVAGLAIFLNYFNVDWFYQGREEYKYISIRSIAVKLISTLMIFVIVREQNDILQYAFIHCFVIGGNNLLNVIGLNSRVKLSLEEICVRKHVRPLLVLFLSIIAIELYTLFDTTMLGQYCSDEVVGYYTYAMRVSKIVVTILTSIFTVLLPRLSVLRHSDNTNAYNELLSKSLRIMGFITLPSAIGLMLISPQVIPILFGKEFLPAVSTLRILSLLAVPVSFNTFIGGVVFISMGMEKERLISVCAGAGLNLIMNSILIPLWAQNGAAIASLISEVIVCVIEFVYLKDIAKKTLCDRDNTITLVSAVIMGIIVLLIQSMNTTLFFKLSISISVGAIVYFVFNSMLKNQTLRLILSKISLIRD